MDKSKSLSKQILLRVLTFVVLTLLADLNSRSATRQQCAAVVLGRIDFSPLPHQSRATTVVDRLVSFMGPKVLSLPFWHLPTC